MAGRELRSSDCWSGALLPPIWQPACFRLKQHIISHSEKITVKSEFQVEKEVVFRTNFIQKVQCVWLNMTFVATNSGAQEESVMEKVTAFTHP